MFDRAYERLYNTSKRIGGRGRLLVNDLPTNSFTRIYCYSRELTRHTSLSDEKVRADCRDTDDDDEEHTSRN